MRLPNYLSHLCASLVLLASAANAASADLVYCHYTYGGETKTLRAEATDTPYKVPTTAVGSYFRFRVVIEAEPVDLAAVKTYVYADHDSGPALIHQGVFPWPVNEAPEQRFGFSGLHRVYEPVRDGEFEYWCSVEDTGRGGS
jgi:hypothetical protein